MTFVRHKHNIYYTNTVRSNGLEIGSFYICAILNNIYVCISHAHHVLNSCQVLSRTFCLTVCFKFMKLQAEMRPKRPSESMQRTTRNAHAGVVPWSTTGFNHAFLSFFIVQLYMTVLRFHVKMYEIYASPYV